MVMNAQWCMHGLHSRMWCSAGLAVYRGEGDVSALSAAPTLLAATSPRR